MKKYLFIIVSLVLITACSSKEKEIGDYLYLEKGPIIHVDNKCSPSSFYIKAVEVYSGKIKGRYCSKCISEKQLQTIEENIQYNVPIAGRIKSIRGAIKVMQNKYEQKTDSISDLCLSVNKHILWNDIYEKVLDLQSDIYIELSDLDYELEEIQKELNAILP